MRSEYHVEIFHSARLPLQPRATGLGAPMRTEMMPPGGSSASLSWQTLRVRTGDGTAEALS